MITQFLPKSQVWKRLWKITFCGLKHTGSGLGEPGGTTPPRIPRSTPNPSPGAGPSITYLFRLESHLLFVQVRSPFLEKPGNFSGSKANFEIKTGPLIRNLFNLKFETGFCFLQILYYTWATGLQNSCCQCFSLSSHSRSP